MNFNIKENVLNLGINIAIVVIKDMENSKKTKI